MARLTDTSDRNWAKFELYNDLRSVHQSLTIRRNRHGVDQGTGSYLVELEPSLQALAKQVALYGLSCVLCSRSGKFATSWDVLSEIVIRGPVTMKRFLEEVQLNHTLHFLTGVTHWQPASVVISALDEANM